MRVMTFNIQHALDYQNRVIDLPLFAREIAAQNVDVCGLNEVRGEGPAENYTDQTNALGDLLGYARYFGEAIRVRGENPYGNAIVSRLPFRSVETVAVPDPADKNDREMFESRCVIRAVVNADGKDVCFLVCHMGLMPSERKNAVETLCRLLDENTMPTVVMGDFNTHADSGDLDLLYQRLRDTDGGAGTYTFPSYGPEEKIDYIFYRGMTCTSVQVIEKVVSDHFPIVAEFTLN